MPFVFDLPDPDATAALAARIAPHLGPGDVVTLAGGLGAGKSHFARALIATRLVALGRSEDIPSPSYTLVQTYDLGAVQLWHADLYRLSGPGETGELGLVDAFETAICLVEWPDRLGAELPARHLSLTLEFGIADDARKGSLVASGPGWDWLAEAIRP